ncbi:MAG: putative metal-binding motif-containing protein, partial [Deltaproteobacteria bacterium]|nr:putative metal-binding motif-containing protein [Deltaproteobacteria bacterium]
MQINRWFVLLGLACASLIFISCGSNSSNSRNDSDSTDLSGTDSEPVDSDSGKGTDGTDETDSSIDSNSDQSTDSSDSETGNEENPTLKDYLTCENDEDCPVGLGDCVKSVSLSVPDGELNSVSVKDLFKDLKSSGICTKVCTNAAASCEEMSLLDSHGDSVPFTCQLIYSGTSPYPSPAPAFPFDDKIDLNHMNAGVPFGAICRPPLGLDPAIEDSICSDCNNSGQCGSGICWDMGTFQEVVDGNGSCLAPCSDSCPLGFTCEILVTDPEQNFCVPVELTFGGCRDLDGDKYGVGQCSDDKLPTPVDCDDLNNLAYYNSNNMNHSFPENCGLYDYNCNGISDDEELIVSTLFGEEHCGACDATCTGELYTNTVNTAHALCVTDNELVYCSAECLEGYADCDGDVNNGCEVVVTDPSYVYYRDNDGDGEGDPERSAFACNGNIPDGYVANNTDCNDVDADIYAGHDEICDGKDNDCDTSIDESFNVGVACDGADSDKCEHGTLTCSADKLSSECVNEIVEDIAESCNGKDDDCDGSIDEDWSELGTPCDGNDSDQCKNGTWTCNSAGSGVECVNETQQNISEICNDDDKDEDCDGSIDEGFDVDGDGYYQCSHGGKLADCNDSEPTNYPGNNEICDGKDNNCNGTVDDGFGVGTPCDGSDDDKCTNGTLTCTLSGYGTECVNESIHISETCDGADNDCDGSVDEGFDGDGDGYYSCINGGPNHKAQDCCDSDNLVHPGQTSYFSYEQRCGGYDY